MKHKNLILLGLTLWLVTLNCHSEPLPISEEDKTFLPRALIHLDDRFSHHVIVVEKSTHTLYLYENDNSYPKLIKKYRIATGKVAGDKKSQGDYKTPEGIYQLESFLSKKQLLEKYGDYANMYGAGAFTMNYPNVIDARQGKTGGGIWLHSTDDDTRIEKGLDSRGCVVAVDQDLIDISRFIDLEHTSIITLQELHFVKKDVWLKKREDMLALVQKWVSAWQKEDLDEYMDSYSKHFRSPTRGNFTAYRNYKKAVFRNPGRPEINLSHISILVHDDYAVVQMQQDYKSSTIQNIGKKILYLDRDDRYQWKITAELFQKLEQKKNIAFTPSLRFFKGEKSVVKQ